MVRRVYREIRYPCLKCGVPITPSRATYLFSIRNNRNVGPFHRRCSEELSCEDEDELWASPTALKAAHTYGPTNAREEVR